MTAVRNSKDTVEYSVIIGEYIERFFGKRIAKRFKKTPHPWDHVLTSMKSEYRFLDHARLQRPKTYNIISSSQNGKYLLVKHELKVPKSNRSASRGGYRVGLFVEVAKKVTILFVGHHGDFKKVFSGSDKNCFKHLCKKYYPNLFKKLKPVKA